ncbi:MAG: PKD domain-containing protein [Vicingus serpentipes]|nr:PKD domain-containing protein [Vicingus serpentipes]
MLNFVDTMIFNLKKILILFLVASVFFLGNTVFSQNDNTINTQGVNTLNTINSKYAQPEIVNVTKENTGVATEITRLDGKKVQKDKAFTVSLTYQNASCGVCDGGLTAITNGGTGPFTYQWHWGPNGNNNPIPGETNPSITGLCADTLVHVVVTDLGNPYTYSYQSPVLDGNSVIGVNDFLSFTLWTNYTHRIPQGDPNTTQDDYFYICNNECIEIWVGGCYGCPDQGVVGVIDQSTGGGPFIYTWSDDATGATGPGRHQFCPTAAVPTTYTVTVQDASCLTVTRSSSPPVREIPDPSINILTDSVSCNGVCDGGADAIVTGGTGAYTYLWSSGESTVTASSLCAGTDSHTLIVTDSLGCQDSAVVTIYEPPLLTIDGVTLSHPTCGSPSGSIDIAASGGTPSLLYSVDNGATYQASSLFTGLAQGPYTIVVRDNNGCTADTAVTLVLPGSPTVTSTGTTSICDGDATPINATAVGGDGNYTFSWNGGALNGAGPHSVFPTTTTTYTVLVVDGNGCKDSADAIITVDPLPNANAGPDVSLCIGSNVQLSASGGNQYVWSPVSELNNPNIPNPISSATITRVYTVTVTDVATGCSNTDNVTVTVNPLPTVFAGNDASVCSGGNLQLNATGGISYSWSPTTGLNNPNIANPIATPPATTLYTVTATDANGCVASDDINITVNAANFLTVGPDVGICPGTNTTLSATGGTTYSWTPTTGLNNPNIGNPVASPAVTTQYTVISSNAGGCQDTGMVTVTVYPPAVANAGTDVEICPAGNIGLNALGGVSYAWSPITGLNNPSIGNPIASPTATTTYTVTVTDANGCIDTDDILVTVNPLPNINAGNNASICIGTSTTLGASGGVSYTWTPTTNLSNPNIANPVASPTATTTYTVTGTDAKGCINTANVTVTVNPLPNASAGPDDFICTGSSKNLNATGGVTYSWSPITGLNNPNIANPVVTPTATTTYTVTVTDVNGCVNTDDVLITLNPLPTVLAGNDQVICSGVTAQLQAGGNAITYDWFVKGNPVPVSSGTTFNVTPSSTVEYVLRGTDAAGCISWDTVMVTVDPTPVAKFSAGSICEGNSMVFNNTSIGGANYSWNFGDPTSSSNTSMVFSPLHFYQDSGTYLVTLIVSTSIGCADTTTRNVRVNYVPQPTFNGGQPGCPPVTSTFRNTSLDYNSNYTYTWIFGDGRSVTSNDTSITYTYTKPGIYDVTLRVLTPEGCPNELTKIAYVEIYPMPDANFIATPSITNIYAPLISFTDRSLGADQWFWNFGDATGSIEQHPRHEYTDTGSYLVWLRVENIYGCTDSISKPIVIRDVYSFYAPNAFTPDDDGINEAFIPQGYAIDYDHYTLYIFDRWGEMIYKTHDYFAGWNGGKNGNIVQEDVYVWKVELKDIYGVDHQYIGRVTVIK